MMKSILLKEKTNANQFFLNRIITMPTDRTAYKYHFKIGNAIVHAGITNDIDRRELDHR